MAFETGQATDIPDLISKLSTFLTANGWTEDQRDNTARQFAFHKNSVYFSGKWGTDTANIMSLHQALAYTGGTRPGEHTDDSGQGYNATSSQTRANLLTERHVDFANVGPYPNYWFFENDASPAYIHVVVEISTGLFVHFGAGELVKFNDWTGGEYVYGHYHTGNNEAQADSTFLLDGYSNSSSGTDEDRPATLHVEGLTSQPVSGKWGIVWSRDTNLGTDRAGIARVMVQGGFRGGPITADFGNFGGSVTTGLIPLPPITLWHVSGDIAVGSGALACYLGYMADVRQINIRFFTAGQEIAYGGDTWVIFPASMRETNSVAKASGYLGVAYKKVTA